MTSLQRRLVLLVVLTLAAAVALSTFVDLQRWMTRQQDVLLLATFAAVAAWVILLGADAMVRQPVVRLLEVAERLRRGDLAARVGTRFGDREFTLLGAAIDAVAQAHQTREQALRDALAAAGLAQAALGEGKTRLRLALSAADLGIGEVDLLRGLSWLDDRAAALTRGMLPANVWLARDDAALGAWLDDMHAADWAARKARLRAVIAGQADTLAVEYRVRGADGRWRWLAECGAVLARDPTTRAAQRVVLLWRDITAERDAAAALELEVAERTAELRDSERRFRSIFDSTFQLTALLRPDGTVLEANRAALTFFGVSAEAARGRRIWEATRLDGERAARLRDSVAFAAAGQFVRYEAVLPGEPAAVALDFSLKPIIGEGGGVTMLMAEARDITEHNLLQAQLAQAQKMEAVGQLTGGVSHDFNNLLQAVTGNLDLIHRLAAQSGDARLLHLTANAQKAAARGARLTQQLLAFSRRQALRPERVRVTRLVAGMSELLRRAAGETTVLVTEAAADLWWSHIDPSQFESALLNLAINAHDAMPNGGTLAVVAANATFGAAEALRLAVPPGDYVRVDVSDTGTGIPAELLSRLFEPFFTTKEVGKGTGLGLAMVHGFARQSGGAVSIASQPGRGTTVSIVLPRYDEAAPAPRQEPIAPASPTAARLAILIVEDDAEVLDAVQFALADAGHRVIAVAAGREAMAVLEAPERLDILLCDLMLPGDMDGLAVAEAARRLRPGLRVIIASGYGEAIAGNRFEVLAKPFSQAELLDRVAAGAAAGVTAG